MSGRACGNSKIRVSISARVHISVLARVRDIRTIYMIENIFSEKIFKIFINDIFFNAFVRIDHFLFKKFQIYEKGRIFKIFACGAILF